MLENIGPKPVSRRAYRSMNEDGLPDLALGLGLLLGALYVGLNRFFRFDLSPVVALLPGVILLALAAVRRRVTYPRVGYAAPRGLALTLTGIVILLGIVVYVLDARRGRQVAAGLPAGILALYGAAGAVVMAWVGWRTGLWRYYFYAGFIALAALAPWLLKLGTSARLIILTGMPGLVMTGFGIAALVRFLHKYPKPAPEANRVVP